jgi:hypothetical protein
MSTIKGIIPLNLGSENSIIYETYSQHTHSFTLLT